MTSSDISMFEKAEEVLAHFGVKGMRWGVRREKDNTPDGEVVTIQNKPGTKVTAKGGKGIPAHEDAVKAAAAKRKASASTTDALSNKELQELVNRMNLESQYAKLTNPNNKNNQNSLKRGMATVKQILEAKKTYDQLTQDPFINDAVNGIKEDLGINNLLRKAASQGAQQVFKPR